MLRSAIICPDPELTLSLREALAETRQVGLVRTVDHFPSHMDLVRMLRAAAPELVFVGMEPRLPALELVERIEEQQPGTQIVAVARHTEPATLLEVMRAGIREFLGEPFEQNTVRDALLRIQQNLARKPAVVECTDSVVSFLPSKPGSGASTLAVNACVAMAEASDDRVLLVDFDLNCGMVGFMLQVEAPHSVVSAAERALDMDEVQWQSIVTRRDNLDVLPAGELAPGFRIEAIQIHQLLDFARRNYRAIGLDLSGLMERYSLEALRESKQIFLVCTPEVPSVHLAREKLAYLRREDLADRVFLLLNRVHKRSLIPAEEVERILEMPVYLSFPNDYEGVHQAVTTGKGLRAGSELGKKCRALADMVVAKRPAVA